MPEITTQHPRHAAPTADTQSQQEAAKPVLELRTPRTAKDNGLIAGDWRPWRAAAARMLGYCYRTLKQRGGAPIAAAPSATSAQRSV